MRVITFVLVPVFLFLTGCSIFNALITFEIENSAEFTVPASIAAIEVLDSSPDVQTSSQQTFENNNTRADLVENVKLSELTLTITDPDGRTFSFLKSLKIYISNDSEGESLIAEIQDIPEDAGRVIELDTTGAVLDEYIKEDSFDLRFEAVTRETTATKTDIRADMVFRVKAKGL